MQYNKLRKKSWWLIFLFIPLLVGCHPVTPLLWNFFVYLGNDLRVMVAGQTIEIVFDKLGGYLSDRVDRVIVDADDPLKGTYATDLRFEGETANCQYSYYLKKPRMFRTSINAIWQPISEAKERIKKSFDENC